MMSKKCKTICATKAITGGKSMASWDPEPKQPSASIKKLRICRSQDGLTPRLPANLEWDQNQWEAVLKARARRSGKEAKRLATRLNKLNPSQRARKWVKD